MKLPKYLPKNSFTTLVVGFVRLNENRFILPYSQNYKKNHMPIKINIPPLLLDKNIKEIRIIPEYKEGENIKYSFSGKRVKRGMYKTSKGDIVNADINGALNILKKSKVVDIKVLYHRGEVDTPVRIRVS